MTNLMTQNKVTEGALIAVPEPDFTKSWHPLSHEKVITALNQACADQKLTIARKEYGATHDMQRFFGVWEIDNGHEDFNFSIGVRNALDKRFAIGVCAGKRTFVCDNLMFSSDFVIFRKHTGRLEIPELTVIATEAIKAVTAEFAILEKWHSSLKEIPLPAADAALLTLAAMRSNVIDSSKYSKFHDLYFGQKTKYTPTLHGWHGAVTEMYKTRSLLRSGEYHPKLTRFIDYEVPKLLEQGSVHQPNTQIDFAAIEDAAILADTDRRAIRKAETRESFLDARKEAQKESRPSNGKAKKSAEITADPAPAQTPAVPAVVEPGTSTPGTLAMTIAPPKPKSKPKKKAAAKKKKVAKPAAKTKKPAKAKKVTVTATKRAIVTTAKSKKAAKGLCSCICGTIYDKSKHSCCPQCGADS